MSVPEYVFMHRIQEFYDQLRAGRNLWKIDETLGFVDERGREMIKRWVQDERYPWTFGQGYTILTQPAPVISLVIDADSDRPGGTFLGNFADEGIDYEPDETTPQSYWRKNVRLKTGTFLFVFTAPNADMLNAMYALIERALYEGETPPVNEENIITFSDYGISELRYRGSDVHPDQNYIPTATFARTLSVSCTYPHQWSGKIFGKTGFAVSINLGNIYASPDETVQINPEFVDGVPLIPDIPNPVFEPPPGVNLQATTFGSIGSTVFTTNGEYPTTDNILRVMENTSLSFVATITANMNGSQSAMWRFSGIIRREGSPSTTTLVGIDTPTVIADPIFSTTFIEISADTSVGALIISATGLPDTSVTWTANIQVKESM